MFERNRRDEANFIRQRQFKVWNFKQGNDYWHWNTIGDTVNIRDKEHKTFIIEKIFFHETSNSFLRKIIQINK